MSFAAARPSLEEFRELARRSLHDLFGALLPNGYSSSQQPETNALGLLLAHRLAQALIADPSASIEVWSSPKRRAILDKVFQDARVAVPLRAGEGSVDTAVWASSGGRSRLVLASECEAHQDQWTPFNADSWWEDGYLWDMSKLCTEKARNLLFVGRAKKNVVPELRTSIERFFKEAPRPDYQLADGQVLYILLLAAGKSEAAHCSVGLASVLWDSETTIEWMPLLPPAA